MSFQKALLTNFTLAVGTKKRLMPGIDVSKWDRLHFHIGADARSIAGLSIRILFGTPVAETKCGALLADSVVWCEGKKEEIIFSHDIPTSYNGTGIIMSVPVVAPLLYDVILENKGTKSIETLYVMLMTQEI